MNKFLNSVWHRDFGFLSFAVFTSLFFISGANTLADKFPIVDVQCGYLIGAVENGKRIEADNAKKSVKSGTKLQVYGATGAAGNATIVKSDTAGEACPDQPLFALRCPKIDVNNPIRGTRRELGVFSEDRQRADLK